MLTDGDIDYRTFTRAQLEDALQRIDPGQYPLNHSRLVRELAARPQQLADAIVLPNRLVLNGMLSFTIRRAVPSIFVVLGLLTLLQALGVTKAMTTNFPLGVKPWNELLGSAVCLGGAAFLYFWLWPMKSVVLEGKDLLVRDFFTSVRVPVSDVDELNWIRPPDRDLLQIAEIRLKKPCVFGTQISFDVSNTAGVQLLQTYLKTRSANDDGA
jgi:hypothetical protein